MENEVVLFRDGEVELEVQISPDQETVWLTQDQMSDLFETARSSIAYHIGNIFREEELDKHTSVEIFDRSTYKASRPPAYYNLDVIISVGYRVKSKRGIAFRKWANSVLKQYIMQGYAINSRRMNQLGEVLRIMKRTESRLDANQVLSVIEKYSVALDLLDDSFKGSIGNIYQSFAGQEIYPSLEEKAANLLYLVTKNHSFSDGNKRIAATMFLYFLDRNGILFDENVKLIDDHTLVALTIMIAESKPDEKEMMVSVIMNCIG